MRNAAIPILVSVVCLALSLASASAQSVVVHVTAAESGNPIPGAFVTLLDEQGRAVRSALTNDAGRFLFSLSNAGRFSVKAELIGRATRVSEPVVVRTNESSTIPLSLSIDAIALDEIRVEPDTQCRLRPDEASEIAKVWDAVRKPLAVQAWTEQLGRHRLEITTYERDLDRTGRKVERESRRGRTAVTRTPFASLPGDTLIDGGFVHPTEDGGYQYYAPDASLLLSDAFLNTHCFRLTRSRDVPGSIGLGFEPVQAGERPDIEGTLWLDEQSSHLRFLDYRYTWAPYDEARGVAGGRVEFEAMPDGAWIIGRWWIRAPITVRYANLARAGDTGIRVAGIRETGGEVIGVSTLTRERIAQVERGSLTGIVWDSTRAQPLEAATIRLNGTEYAAQSDSSGRFLLAGLPAGVFMASFDHPRLDTLGIDALQVETEIRLGIGARIDLAIPSLGSILLAACHAEGQETRAAALSGRVSNLASGDAIPGAMIRLEWQDIERTRPILQAREQWLEVAADAEGRYTACGVPIDRVVRIRASLLTYQGSVTEVSFADASHRAVDLEIDLPPAAVSAAGASTTAFGAQGLQGVLLDRETGSPVRSAQITVRHLSGDVVATGETNERGFFRVTAPIPGRFLLFAQALGYDQLSGEVVDVVQGKLSVLDIRMVPAALELDPLIVTAEPRAFHLEMEGFYRRREERLGKFMTPEIFEQRKPRLVSDLLFGLAGANVAEPTTGIGGRAVYFGMGVRAGQICWPMVYVNRQLVSTGGFLGNGAEPAVVDEIVPAADIWAMEVYDSPAEIPSEFNGPNAGCGVIVLWTRRGGSD
jgi:hypothetical protein